jgi:hypothetical protein
MSEMSYAQLKEEKLREIFKEKYPTLSSFSYPNQFMIEQIESILESFPLLKTLNFNELSIKSLLSLIETLIDDVKVFTNEDNTVLIVEANVTKPFITMKEFIVMFLFSALTGFSLFHFIFTKKKLETIDFKDVEAFPYIYNNSVVLTNHKKQQYHFFMSLSSFITDIYTSIEAFLNTKELTVKSTQKCGDTSIANYIDSGEANKDIDDSVLTDYLQNNPQDFDTSSLYANRNVIKNKNL